MSGFTAPAPSPQAPPISNGGWWPDIDPAAARDILRIDGTVSDPRLREALINAISSVTSELATWQSRQEASGADDLAAVPAPVVDNQSRLVHLFRRAVYCTAAAQLIERYRNYDITASGQKEADQQTPAIDEMRRDARWCIRDILGQARATVELI